MRLLLFGLVAACALLAQPRFPQRNNSWPAQLPLPLDSHAGRLGAVVAGRPVPLGAPGARPQVPIVRGPIFSNPAIWFPMTYAPPPSPVYVIQNAAPAPAPTIVSVNPDYKAEVARPVMTEYHAISKPYENVPEPGSGQLKVYLLALKDGTLRQAVAFWHEGSTLHFILPDHKQSSIAWENLDREASIRFNRERGLELRLPD